MAEKSRNGNVVQIDEELADRIAEALQATGYIVLPGALPDGVAEQLHTRVSTLGRNELNQASIGRGRAGHKDGKIRGDSIAWMNSANPCEAVYLDWMESLRLALNRRLYIGLFDYESHFAVYPKGSFYRKHLDVLAGNENRVLSTVYYLNPDWKANDGGELVIYPEKGDGPVEIVSPLYGHMVIFLSARFPHEVKEARCERYSITGWFRVNSSTTLRVDPSR